MEENSNDDQIYMPEVVDERKPKIGMEFGSVDEAFLFYNHYAREAGFSTRINNSKKDKITNEAQSGTNWAVSAFQESHNHPLSTPSKAHLLRSHRTVSEAKKALTQQFSEANVSTCQQIRLLEIEYGGSEHIGCTETDIRNFERDLKNEQKVVFDTTYNTNKYGMIFAPLVGVNHHHQTIVFGCEFLSDEKTESFVWLLNKFVESIPTGAPNVITTDQDPAMTKAIAQVFPQTMHQYCLWHILNKFSEKLDPMTFRDHYQSIKHVIENSTTPDEFVSSWEEAMKCAKLEGNDWLQLMYDLRKKCVPTYLNHVFAAGMSSSQRSESSHSFFKRYVSKKNSLVNFIIRFNRALKHQRHNELVSDHVDRNECPKIKGNLPMEHQMVKVYTKKKNGLSLKVKSVRVMAIVCNKSQKKMRK
ncbi:protein FAR1-RELATED SEQUENCE 5-like [Henckelia pumila]|uniref:protein FAR1-RELATED SEQUENCE 5-like n=1 Tax=Henckelia pumila TaxID=405737 RepID=UPI003C6E55AD